MPQVFQLGLKIQYYLLHCYYFINGRVDSQVPHFDPLSRHYGVAILMSEIYNGQEL